MLSSLGFGKSKSSNVSSGAAAGYDLQENISQSGSRQGSDASSLGFNLSESGQDIYGGQAPFLNDIYGQAANLFHNYGMPDRQVAGINPMLAAGLGQQFGFGQGMGQDIFTAQLMSALGNMGGFGTAAGTAGRMAGGNVFGAPMTDGLNMATLGAAVNNPFLDGQIDAASRDVVRNLNENQLTGNAAMAAGTGNSGSSRRAVMDAIAQRGAADRVADIGSTMRGQAFNTGLGLANQTALANQNAMMGTNAVNAGLMGQGANLGFQLGQAGQQGLGQAFNTGVQNTALSRDAGDFMRQYQQQLLDTMYGNQMNPYNSLQMYRSMIGDPTVLSRASSLGVDQSRSGSFGDSFNNSYGYGMGANTSTQSATGNSSSFNANLGFGK
jgi:hypothetical protein